MAASLSEDTFLWDTDPPPPLDPEIPEDSILAQRNLEHGQELFKSGKYREAEFFIRKSLFKAPGNLTAVKLLPWAYFYERRFDKSLAAFRNARAQFDRDPEPVIGMAWSYLAMQFFEKAFETFEKAESLSANPRQAILGKGLANLFMQRKDQAVIEFKKIYLQTEIDQLLDLWERRKLKNPDWPLDIFPLGTFSPTLFTLPTERPRYESMLFGLIQAVSAKVPGQLWAPPGFSGSYLDRHTALPSTLSLLDKAWNYYKVGEYKNALDAFKTLPSADADSVDGMNGLGWSYLLSDDIIRAEKIFRESLENWPNFVGAKEGLFQVHEALMKKAAEGQHNYDSENYQIAEENFKKIRGDYPDWSHSHSMLGWIHLKQNNFDEAGKRFMSALELDPEDKAAKEGMKRLHSVFVPKLIEADQALENKDYKKAAKLYWGYISSIDPSAEMTPTLTKAYRGLGWSQLGKGHYRQAVRTFKKIQDAEGYRLDSVRGLGLAHFHIGRFSLAIKFLTEADSLSPDQSDIYYPLYLSVMKIKNPLEAEAYLLEENLKFPRRAAVYLVLGWIYHANQKPDLGVEYFLKAISLNPEIALTQDFKRLLDGERFGWQVMNHLGWAYYHRKRHDTSMALFRWVLRNHPKSSRAMAGMGYNLFKQGNPAEAESFLRQSLERNPYPVAVREMADQKDSISLLEIETSPRIILGRILILQGKHEEALGQFRKEEAQQANRAQALDGMGWSYLRLNRLAEARVAFNEAIRLQPTNHLSHKGLREVKHQIAAEKLPQRPTLPPIANFADGAQPVNNLGVFGE